MVQPITEKEWEDSDAGCRNSIMDIDNDRGGKPHRIS
jgi:hypothetical protein